MSNSRGQMHKPLCKFMTSKDTFFFFNQSTTTAYSTTPHLHQKNWCSFFNVLSLCIFFFLSDFVWIGYILCDFCTSFPSHMSKDSIRRHSSHQNHEAVCLHFSTLWISLIRNLGACAWASFPPPQLAINGWRLPLHQSVCLKNTDQAQRGDIIQRIDN